MIIFAIASGLIYFYLIFLISYMPLWFFHLLDGFMMVFHTGFILFILVGWTIPRLRRIHIACALLTAGSWYILGMFYGLGYCPFTDWHWQVLNRLGTYDLPASYVQYLLKRVANISVSPSFADAITVAGLVIATVFSSYFNIRQLSKKLKRSS